MFSQRSTPDQLKSKFLDEKKLSYKRLKALKEYMGHDGVPEAARHQFFVEKSHDIYRAVQVTVERIQSDVEKDKQQREARAHIFDIVSPTLEAMLTHLQPMIREGWQLRSLTLLMSTMTHPENTLPLRRIGARLLIRFLGVLEEHATLVVVRAIGGLIDREAAGTKPILKESLFGPSPDAAQAEILQIVFETLAETVTAETQRTVPLSDSNVQGCYYTTSVFVRLYALLSRQLFARLAPRLCARAGISTLETFLKAPQQQTEDAVVAELALQPLTQELSPQVETVLLTTFAKWFCSGSPEHRAIRHALVRDRKHLSFVQTLIDFVCQRLADAAKGPTAASVSAKASNASPSASVTEQASPSTSTGADSHVSSADALARHRQWLIDLKNAAEGLKIYEHLLQNDFEVGREASTSVNDESSRDAPPSSTDGSSSAESTRPQDQAEEDQLIAARLKDFFAPLSRKTGRFVSESSSTTDNFVLEHGTSLSDVFSKLLSTVKLALKGLAEQSNCDGANATEEAILLSTKRSVLSILQSLAHRHIHFMSADVAQDLVKVTMTLPESILAQDGGKLAGQRTMPVQTGDRSSDLQDNVYSLIIGTIVRVSAVHELPMDIWVSATKKLSACTSNPFLIHAWEQHARLLSAFVTSELRGRSLGHSGSTFRNPAGKRSTSASSLVSSDSMSLGSSSARSRRFSMGASTDAARVEKSVQDKEKEETRRSTMAKFGGLFTRGASNAALESNRAKRASGQASSTLSIVNNRPTPEGSTTSETQTHRRSSSKQWSGGCEGLRLLLAQSQFPNIVKTWAMLLTLLGDINAFANTRNHATAISCLCKTYDAFAASFARRDPTFQGIWIPHFTPVLLNVVFTLPHFHQGRLLAFRTISKILTSSRKPYAPSKSPPLSELLPLYLALLHGLRGGNVSVMATIVENCQRLVCNATPGSSVLFLDLIAACSKLLSADHVKRGEVHSITKLADAQAAAVSLVTAMACMTAAHSSKSLPSVAELDALTGSPSPKTGSRSNQNTSISFREHTALMSPSLQTLTEFLFSLPGSKGNTSSRAQRSDSSQKTGSASSSQSNLASRQAGRDLLLPMDSSYSGQRSASAENLSTQSSPALPVSSSAYDVHMAGNQPLKSSTCSDAKGNPATTSRPASSETLGKPSSASDAKTPSVVISEHASESSDIAPGTSMPQDKGTTAKSGVEHITFGMLASELSHVFRITSLEVQETVPRIMALHGAAVLGLSHLLNTADMTIVEQSVDLLLSFLRFPDDAAARAATDGLLLFANHVDTLFEHCPRLVRRILLVMARAVLFRLPTGPNASLRRREVLLGYQISALKDWLLALPPQISGSCGDMVQKCMIVLVEAAQGYTLNSYQLSDDTLLRQEGALRESDNDEDAMDVLSLTCDELEAANVLPEDEPSLASPLLRLASSKPKHWRHRIRKRFGSPSHSGSGLSGRHGLGGSVENLAQRGASPLHGPPSSASTEASDVTIDRHAVRDAAQRAIQILLRYNMAFPEKAGSDQLGAHLSETDAIAGVSGARTRAELLEDPNVSFYVWRNQSIISAVDGETGLALFVRDLAGKHVWRIDDGACAGEQRKQTIVPRRPTLDRPSLQRQTTLDIADESVTIQSQQTDIEGSAATIGEPDHADKDGVARQPTISSLDDVLLALNSEEKDMHRDAAVHLVRGTPLPQEDAFSDDTLRLRHLNAKQQDYLTAKQNPHRGPHRMVARDAALTARARQSLADSQLSRQLRVSSALVQLGLDVWGGPDTLRPLKKTKELWSDISNLDKDGSMRETHKVAVFYVGQGMSDKTSIIACRKASGAFEEFVDALGWPVSLDDHQGYTGRLEASHFPKSTMTYYATESLEVAFHVATRLYPSGIDPETPWNSETASFVCEKRFIRIGNDSVHVVWCDADRLYSTSMVPTKFGEVTIVVYPLPTGLYRINIIKKEDDIPFFGPLCDGSLVDPASLPLLIRQTAINAGRALRRKHVDEPVYNARLDRLRRIVGTHAIDPTFHELALSLLQPDRSTARSTPSSATAVSTKDRSSSSSSAVSQMEQAVSPASSNTGRRTSPLTITSDQGSRPSSPLSLSRSESSSRPTSPSGRRLVSLSFRRTSKAKYTQDSSAEPSSPNSLSIKRVASLGLTPPRKRKSRSSSFKRDTSPSQEKPRRRSSSWQSFEPVPDLVDEPGRQRSSSSGVAPP